MGVAESRSIDETRMGVMNPLRAPSLLFSNLRFRLNRTAPAVRFLLRKNKSPLGWRASGISLVDKSYS